MSPVGYSKTALRDLARRWKVHDNEIKALNHQIKGLAELAAPPLVDCSALASNWPASFS